MLKPCEFKTREGLRVSVLPDKVEAIVEHDSGCQIVTSNDTYKVVDSYDTVRAAIWSRR